MKRNRKRPFKADAWVHVYKRRKDKFLLFYTTRDFLVYYTLFFCLAEKHKVRAYGLCIMVDHVHELLQASERERLENFMYSGRYPFSVPVIPVHFLGVKTDYLLRS